jgi:hypothetical protein
MRLRDFTPQPKTNYSNLREFSALVCVKYYEFYLFHYYSFLRNSHVELIAANVSLQLTLAFASANANVPDVKRLTSRETRAEERASATQQLCSVLAAFNLTCVIRPTLRISQVRFQNKAKLRSFSSV